MFSEPRQMIRQAALANDGQMDKITSWENESLTWGKPVDQKVAEKQKEFFQLIPPWQSPQADILQRWNC